MSTPSPSERLKNEVTIRANDRCEYCLSSMRHSSDPFSIEHVHPRVLGGSSTLENLALACQGYNNFKATFTQGRDPVSGHFHFLYHPRRDDWGEHFRWSDDFLELIGVTPVGRATIQRLKLNREGVINLRSLLLLIDLHPPPR